ncbi:hypothetical protein IQ260_10970 [Leptolyngbya cf. ectocarpi LEGE 11479]|uniref:Uncharacterized protein n=1 Tax=Leptolyngbya cf. ectocarpi LEGE 11479 TaxID=1828722 RepID=A0A928X1G7_LEPEC|nr:hypothetical protein [Leptolyngbya ectocarpi]MBE9067177.1 hypothetical protein [Leptolyngbya cf. ectocarpi LEGE 11479]
MRSIHFYALAVVIAFLLPTTSAFADRSTVVPKQSTPAQRKCEDALASVVGSIQEGRDAQVADISASNLSEVYRGYPSGVELEVTLALDGSAADNVMNSPQLMTNASAQLINGCQGVGLVKFNRYYTDWNESFGLIDGTVSQFSQCVEPVGDRQYLEWGQRYCL